MGKLVEVRGALADQLELFPHNLLSQQQLVELVLDPPASMEEVEEIEEIEVVNAITVVLDHQWVVESVTITITWVVATATTIEEVVVVEQMPPRKILSLLDAWECLAWGCTRLKQNYSMYLPNMDHLRKFK